MTSVQAATSKKWDFLGVDNSSCLLGNLFFDSLVCTVFSLISIMHASAQTHKDVCTLQAYTQIYAVDSAYDIK